MITLIATKGALVTILTLHAMMVVAVIHPGVAMGVSMTEHIAM